ncbi:MAG: phosphoglycerate kinase [Candidatus Saccharibacteria bacterium]
MFTKKTVHDIDVKNKTIVLRAMLNVPIKDGKVGDKMRLKAALPTINYLISKGAKIILISHHSHEGQSLEPVAGALSELVGRPVAFASDCIGEVALAAVKALPSGGLLMLENLRFHPEEEANDEEFARTLASYGDIYVNDDFTTCHRSHASLVGIPKFIPAVAGLEVEEEVNTITSSIDNPKRPLVAIAGGAKISTKVPIISFLLDKVDVLFVGGAMANTFLLAKGLEVGNSLVELDQVETAKQIIKSAEEKGKTLLLPIDVVVTTDVKEALNVRVMLTGDVGIDDIIADLGPMSVLQLNEAIKPEGSVIWNGPIGIAEQKEFANGTEMVAEEIISSGAFSIVGGGDTADYVDGAGLADKFGFVSTGGGASLELMSGNTLPGIAALLDK